MTAEPTMLDSYLPEYDQCDPMSHELPEARRTPAEKAAILTRLTIQLVALDDERRSNGHA